MLQQLKNHIKLYKENNKLKNKSHEAFLHCTYLATKNNQMKTLLEDLMQDMSYKAFFDDMHGLISQIDLCNTRLNQMAERLSENRHQEAIQFVHFVETEQNTLQKKWGLLQDKLLKAAGEV